MPIDGAIRKLTPARRAELAEELVSEEFAVREVEDDAKESAKTYREEVNAKYARILELSKAIRMGKEQVNEDGEFVCSPKESHGQIGLGEED